MPSIHYIERLIEEERIAMEEHQERGTHAEDPKLRSLYDTLFRLRSRGVEVLQAYLNECKPEQEIINQINDMFL
jgi:squalene cyclase